MKIAIDSYCYHRYFGEVYPNIETDPGVRLTIADFFDRARRHRVEGVSLESCFFPTFDDATIDECGRGDIRMGCAPAAIRQRLTT